MKPILEVKNLTKRFGSPTGGFTAVDNISFSVGVGEILGLLGPNGAGKTTTMQMLLGLTTATSGTIAYFGKEFPKHREHILSQINFASSYSHIQGKITVLQNFRIYAGLYGLDNAEKRCQELLQLFEVENTIHTPFWKLSSGQKTRVILAKSLLNDPKLILMDEPTASLDPDIAKKVRALIQSLQRSKHVTLLITSHDMTDVEELCDRVIFLDHGQIVAEDTPLGLTKKIEISHLTLTFDGPQEPITKYLKKNALTHSFTRAHVVTIELPERDIPKILFGFSKEKIWITDIEIQKPNLEDVFVSIAKGKYES